LLWLIAHPLPLFAVLLAGLTLVVELGLRLRHSAADIDEERQSLIDSARDKLGVLLSLLLGFSLPMAVPHYEQRRQLMVGEANAIETADQRAEMLPEPFRSKILQLMREYVDARIEFGRNADGPELQVSIDRAKHIQNEMVEQSVMLVQQSPNVVTPIFVQSLGTLEELREQRIAADERRIPEEIWLVLGLMAVLTCFVVGFGMRRRLLLAMFAVPLMVAIVLSLVSELDNPRTGFVRVGQESMERLQLDLKTEGAPGR
jgi:Protein of unknown function (DUF4239)